MIIRWKSGRGANSNIGGSALGGAIHLIIDAFVGVVTAVGSGCEYIINFRRRRR